jgi:hypothetical protein
VKTQRGSVSQKAPWKLAKAEEVSFDNLGKQLDGVKLRHPKAWHTQEAPARTALAWPPATPTSCMPTERVSMRSSAYEVGTCFALACPILDIFNIASTAEIDEFTGLYEHVTCGNDVRDWRISGILPC